MHDEVILPYLGWYDLGGVQGLGSIDLELVEVVGVA